jgi:hypothetical protein
MTQRKNKPYDNKNKRYGKLKRVFKIVNRFGIILLASAIIFIINDYITLGLVCLFLSALSMLPDYWVFYSETSELLDDMSPYWLMKFIGLVIISIVLGVGLVIYLIHKKF